MIFWCGDSFDTDTSLLEITQRTLKKLEDDNKHHYELSTDTNIKNGTIEKLTIRVVKNDKPYEEN